MKKFNLSPKGNINCRFSILFVILLVSVSLSINNVYGQSVYWSGTVSSEWNNSGNWGNNAIPSDTVDVMIPSTAAFKPIVNNADTGNCKDLTIMPGASLTVNGTLNCRRNMFIQSDSSGTGAFVQSDAANVTITGNATVESFIEKPGYNYISCPFNYVASPEAGIKCSEIDGFPFSENNNGSEYDPDNPPSHSKLPNMWRIDERYTHDVLSDYNSWFSTSPNEYMKPMEGYTINVPSVNAGMSISMTAHGLLLKNGDVQYAISKENLSLDTRHNFVQGYGPTNGFHVVGNPYPSPLDWDAVDSAGIPGNITHTILFFKPTAQYLGNYGYYNSYYGGFGAFHPSAHIPSVQSFYIQNTVVSSPILTLKNSYRVTPAKKEKTKNIKFPFLKLTTHYISAPVDAVDECIIMFSNNVIPDFDPKYDFYKFSNADQNYSNIFTIYNNINFAAKSFPANNDTTIVNLGFSVNTKGTYTLNAGDILNFSPAVSIVLLDLRTYQKQDLKINPLYLFSASLTDPANRFQIMLIGEIDIISLHGNLTYDNINSSPIKYSKMYLLNSEKQRVDSTVTDSAGYYRFDNIKSGEYSIEPILNIAWGGVNPVDALILNRSYIGSAKLSDDLSKLAADVNGDKKVNPVDALLINRRYIGSIKMFSVPDILYEKPVIQVNGAEVIQNIKVICTGDVNGSKTF